MQIKHSIKRNNWAAQNNSGMLMRYILELDKSSSLFIGKFLSLVLFASGFLVACSEKGDVERPIPSYDGLNAMRKDAFRFDANEIQQHIYRLAKADKDTLVADARTRRYYKDGGNLLWIDRFGVDERADSVFAYLNEVEEMGFSKRVFGVNQIERDLQRLRTLDVDTGVKNVNRVAARLEYNLTKAFLRYTAGQHYGFTNPSQIFNRLDVREKDSVRTTYRVLFDIPIKRASKDFYTMALRKVY